MFLKNLVFENKNDVLYLIIPLCSINSLNFNFQTIGKIEFELFYVIRVILLMIKSYFSLFYCKITGVNLIYSTTLVWIATQVKKIISWVIDWLISLLSTD